MTSQEVATTVPFDGGPAEQALRTQRVQVLAPGAAPGTTEHYKVLADLLRLAVGTGLRFGELTALWVSDIDLAHRTIRVNKAWKRDGEDDRQETPPLRPHRRKSREGTVAVVYDAELEAPRCSSTAAKSYQPAARWCGPGLMQSRGV